MGSPGALMMLAAGFLLVFTDPVSSSCSCNGDINSEGRGECRTKYRGSEWCYVEAGQCTDEMESTSSNRFWSYKACEQRTSCPRNPVVQGLSRNCCTEEHPCNEGEGDCDTSNHRTCNGELQCGDSNCGDFSAENYHRADCCYYPDGQVPTNQKPPVSLSCSCNGYINSEGRGECLTKYKGSEWCYVEAGQCTDERKGTSSDRRWSYKACEQSTNQLGDVYQVNEEGLIPCQSRSDCPPDHTAPNLDTFIYNCEVDYSGPSQEDQTFCFEIVARAVTCASGRRAKSCSLCGQEDCGDLYEDDLSTTECAVFEKGEIHECASRAFCYWIVGCYDVCSTCDCISCAAGAALGQPLRLTSAIAGTGTLTATNVNSVSQCDPRSCIRENKCCRLMKFGYSNGYLACPHSC